jgi:hypothetical protein
VRTSLRSLIIVLKSGLLLESTALQFATKLTIILDVPYGSLRGSSADTLSFMS